ncbi:hypothetical protein K7472_30340 [Streptomyces sp. PTM05]|uniref:ATP/GTP-binding protein n=1 Tax=Streptantibioticus parmotrematis TaxID=2873249 RepID=A0ABS7R1R5_9ACTN|nr:hypothetical protein [Streptantibioticus parmotrematis]MBY8889113.1 hypothetical protein [Streptantibioticus parmotrematis]
MLTAPLAVAATVVGLLLTTAPGAYADSGGGGSVVCPPEKLDCRVTATGPGTSSSGSAGHSGSSSRGGSVPACKIEGAAVPCHRDDIGDFNPSDACYWAPLSPQPPAGDPLWRLATGLPADWKPGPNQGELYNVVCPGAGREVDGGTFWSARPPAQAGPDLAALARQAVSRMRLAPPAIGIDPQPSGMGLVGMPVWMWNKPGATTTGPASASASAGGVTVTATATVANVTWSMGDGKTVVCTSPGEPYQASYGKAMSPTCGYMYQQTSADQPGGKYHVTATTTWNVHWAGAGQEGDLTVTRGPAAVDIAIGEAQVLGS